MPNSVEETLSAGEGFVHYGIKGMKWGIRREAPSQSTDSDGNTITSRKGKIGGVELGTNTKSNNAPASDASRAAVLKKRAGTKSTDSLSNKELQDLVNRMNLEQQYSRLTGGQNKTVTKQITDILLKEGKQEFAKFAQKQMAQQVANALKK